MKWLALTLLLWAGVADANVPLTYTSPPVTGAHATLYLGKKYCP